MVLNQSWLTCYNCLCYAMLPVTTRTIAVISYDAWIKCLFKLQMMKQIFKKKPSKTDENCIYKINLENT